MRTSPADRGLRPRHVVVGAAAAAAVMVGLVSALTSVNGIGALRRVVAGGDYRWLVLCVIGQVVVFGGYAGALRRTIAAGGDTALTVGQSVLVVLASFAATQLFAFAGIGGLALMYLVLRRVGFDRQAALERLIGLNTAVYLVLGGLGWGAAFLVLADGRSSSVLALAWIVAIPLIVLAARWFTAAVRVERWAVASTRWYVKPLGTGVAAAAWVRRQLATSAGRRLFGWAGAVLGR